MMRHLGIAAGALALALAAAGPASAAKVIYTFTGKVNSTQNFPPIDATTGDDFVATFTADDSATGAIVIFNPDGSDLLSNNLSFAPMSLKLSIDEYNISVGDNSNFSRHSGRVSHYNNAGFGFDRLILNTNDSMNDPNGDIRSISATFKHQDDTGSMFSNVDFRRDHPTTLLDIPNDSTEFIILFQRGRFTQSGYQVISSARIELMPTSLTITGGIVPEPATWALMIGGFGMAGTMLRRRRAPAA